MGSSRKNRERGLTLIEAVMVLCIMTVCLAGVMTVFQKSQERALAEGKLSPDQIASMEPSKQDALLLEYLYAAFDERDVQSIQGDHNFVVRVMEASAEMDGVTYDSVAAFSTEVLDQTNSYACLERATGSTSLLVQTNDYPMRLMNYPAHMEPLKDELCKDAFAANQRKNR